jgi:hypothetical protein
MLDRVEGVGAGMWVWQAKCQGGGYDGEGRG